MNIGGFVDEVSKPFYKVGAPVTMKQTGFVSDASDGHHIVISLHDG